MSMPQAEEDAGDLPSCRGRDTGQLQAQVRRTGAATS